MCRDELDSRRVRHFAPTLSEVIMKSKLIAALLVATSAALATPAFASGYGPAPFYRPDVGAPSSQQGPSAQTLAAERGDRAVAQRDVGGTVESSSMSGSVPRQTSRFDDTYRGH
jgi:hypothetical protein